MDQPTTNVLIMGTGTFAEEIADVVSEIPGVTVTGFVENLDARRCDERIANLPVFWVEGIGEMAATHWAICGLGTTQRERYVAQVLEYNMRFATLVHPSARISTTTPLGEGVFVGCGAIIASQTQIGRHVIVNRGALIGHHTHIGSFVTVGPGANIAGNSRIGDGTYVGMNASVIDHVSVGAHSVIGAGAVVTRDVPDNVQVVGMPAKIVKEGIEGK